MRLCILLDLLVSSSFYLEILSTVNKTSLKRLISKFITILKKLHISPSGQASKRLVKLIWTLWANFFSATHLIKLQSYLSRLQNKKMGTMQSLLPKGNTLCTKPRNAMDMLGNKKKPQRFRSLILKAIQTLRNFGADTDRQLWTALPQQLTASELFMLVWPRKSQLYKYLQFILWGFKLQTI